MLEKIKSKYFSKNIFTFLDERRKLNFIKYNQGLQNILNINITNYKIFTGSYIEYENNNKIKIFNVYTDQILFEGEYLNGKLNGKGKSYYENGNIEFEGEYLNGIPTGKGKKYYENRKIKNEVEFLNGEVNRKGKIFYENGNLKFEGEYLNGKTNGKGKYRKSRSHLREGVIYEFTIHII